MVAYVQILYRSLSGLTYLTSGWGPKLNYWCIMNPGTVCPQTHIMSSILTQCKRNKGLITLHARDIVHTDCSPLLQDPHTTQGQTDVKFKLLCIDHTIVDQGKYENKIRICICKYLDHSQSTQPVNPLNSPDQNLYYKVGLVLWRFFLIYMLIP